MDALTVPLIFVQKPLFLRRSLIFSIGAIIHKFTPEDLLRCPFIILDFMLLKGEITFFISTPRNLAYPERAFVISVFSSDRVSFRCLRNSPASSFIFTECSLFPQTPIIQSSAYLTYSISQVSGLLTTDFSFLRSESSFSSSFLRALSGHSPRVLISSIFSSSFLIRRDAVL